MATKSAEFEIHSPLGVNDPEELLSDMEEFLAAIECLQDDLSPMSEAEIIELQEDADYLRSRIEESRLANDELERMRAAHTRARIQYTLEVERYVTMSMQMEISRAMQAKRQFPH